MNRSFWPALATLLVVSLPCTAQTSLHWKFERSIYLEVRHVTKRDVSAAGKTGTEEITNRFVFKVHPLRAEPALREFEITVLASEDTTTKGGKTEKDTLKGFNNQKFRLSVGADNQSIKLHIAKELIESVFGEDAVIGSDDEKQFFATMVETVLRVHLIDAFVPLPGKEVSPGDKWKNTADLKVPPLFEVLCEKELVLAGGQIHDGKRVEVINWTSQLELKPLGGKGPLPFKIPKLKATGTPRYDGTVLWDASLNHPIRVDSIQNFELEMEIEAKGKVIKGKGSETDTFVTRFFDKNPDEK